MKLNLYMLSFLLGLTVACSQTADDEGLPPLPPLSPPANDYLQLAPGNYWVYQSLSRDLNTGELSLLSKLDSLYGGLDTLIDRVTHQVLRGTLIGEAFEAVLRVSGPEALNAKGQLFFTTNEMMQPYAIPQGLLPPGAQSSEGVVATGGTVEVPYGTYPTLDFIQEVTLSPEYSDAKSNTRRVDTFSFARGVGLLRYVQYYPETAQEVEMQLIRAYQH